MSPRKTYRPEKLRTIDLEKPISSQIKGGDADSTIAEFERKKKADTTIQKVKKNYLEGATSLGKMK